ncbi:NTP transferase domain-containing protein [Microvirga arabica]|uniref:NTP transferase domain-containing protein n=1 Tax=Microvirga arabica TaxID=1128671 RepID=UPI003606EA64
MRERHPQCQWRSCRFSRMTLPIVPDSIPDYLGRCRNPGRPRWSATHRPDIDWVVSAPADTPFIPHDLVLRLHEAFNETRKLIACATSAPRHISPWGSGRLTAARFASSPRESGYTQHNGLDQPP